MMRLSAHRFSPVLSALVGLVSQAVAAESGIEPARHVVDTNRPPWSAVAVLNNSVYGRCTAILLRPDIAVTAAHCLYSRRTRRFVRPQSVHLLFGFARGAYGFHTTASGITLAEGYDPAEPAASVAHDWALLRLAEPAPAPFRPIGIAVGAATSEAVVAAGFGQERSEVLTATAPCRVEGRTPDGLIVSDCRLSHGFSGGPLIDAATGELVGIGVAEVSTGETSHALAIPASAMIDRLPRR